MKVHELVQKEVVELMTVIGLEEHEKQGLCEIEPIYGEHGRVVGTKTVCDVEDTPTEDCELIPVIDKNSG